MIEIDGGIGEAGGQILRTSLGLSVLTQQDFKIVNIRINRSNPGLREQHLQAVRSVKKLCNAEVLGDELHSKELIFKPDKITKKKLKIEVRTAGANSLILQTLFLASLNNNLNVRIKGGGTWNIHAPSVLYLQEVFLPLLEKLGLKNKIEILRNGFYPKGGAIVDAKIKKTNLEYIDLISKERLKKISIISIASSHLKKAKVGERQLGSAANLIGKKFSDIKINTKVDYVDSICPGSGILCKAEFDNTILGYGVVGERGKQSEIVGKESANGLMKFLDVNVDEFMIDQILPFLAYGGGGKVKFLEMTDHAKTNMKVIKQFLDVKFIESSFFPIPPDILLVVLALGNTKLAFFYALICTLGSVLGGMFGYGIGFLGGEVVLRKFVNEERYSRVHNLFNKYEALAVLAGSLTPIPYKVITIGAGVFYIKFWKFVVYSIIGRGFRYFLEATLIFIIGDKLLEFLKKGIFDWIALIY